MRFLVHAALAAILIVSDATHAATLGGTRTRAPSEAASDDDARFRQNEAAWRRIMASICTGCGGPAPKLEIVRKRPDITRLERQAGIGVPLEPSARVPAQPRTETALRTVADTGERELVETKPVAERVERRTAAVPVPEKRMAERASVETRSVVRTVRRADRTALHARRAARLARLRRVREQVRLARRGGAAPYQRLAQAVPPAPRPRQAAWPVTPTVPVHRAAARHLVERQLLERGAAVRQAAVRQGTLRQVVASAPSLLPRSWPQPGLPQPPRRIYVDAREVAFARSRAVVCPCTIR